MNVTLFSAGPDGGRVAATSELHRWLQRQPELRARLVWQSATAPPPGTMGASGELLTLLLAPGGVTAALAAAVVAWLQNRRGDQTVTITLPDQTQITVSSTKVRGLTAQATGDLAQRVAAAIDGSGRTADNGTERNALGAGAVPGEANSDRPSQPAGNDGERA
ncbi:effector-associated constant component EACC1 [Streptomyces eurythermus]|uniref:effector-associated constant component EACC1 n=1 Tax=Streptomyces eurythermus TaxID=42237 RepID=UPI0036D4079E